MFFRGFGGVWVLLLALAGVLLNLGVLGVLFGEFGGLCHFEPFAKRRKIHIVILSVSEKSKEFETRLKALKSHFDFMDTSLSCESSV